MAFRGFPPWEVISGRSLMYCAKLGQVLREKWLRHVRSPACKRFGVESLSGSSAIIDPRGVILAAASPDREDLVHADVSEELVQSVRRRVYSLGHRRENLYR